MFHLHNVRLGFACNSSSTHSLIFLPGTPRGDDIDAPGEYGWEHFTLSSPEAKRDYLGTLLYEQIAQEVGEDAARAIAREWVGNVPGEDGSYIYVDHQSRVAFPRDFGGKLVSRRFVEDLRQFLLQNDLVVLGGNDNSEYSHPLAEGAEPSFHLPLVDMGGGEHLVARKDGEHWVIFNQLSGAKIRLSFPAITPESVRSGEKVERWGRAYDFDRVEKASTPELADVKTTDFCPYGCPYCYQGSTTSGKHADMKDIRSLAYALKELQVFEVALGGGEPTLHPQFLEILRTFRRYDIVPNFTTRNLAWLKGEERAEILSLTGSFAFSADRAEDIHRLGVAMQYHTGGVRQASVQIVERVVHPLTFKQMLREAQQFSLPVTLLGYKETHRGADHKERIYDYDWTEVVSELHAEGHLPRLSIDTVLADRDAEKLLAMGVPEWMFTRKEGKFSMYVDAVEKKIAPSSFCSDEEHVSYAGESRVDEVIRTHFPRW